MAVLGAVRTAPLAAATNDVAELPSVVVTASPISQAERVSMDGAETVLVSREQLALLIGRPSPFTSTVRFVDLFHLLVRERDRSLSVRPAIVRL